MTYKRLTSAWSRLRKNIFTKVYQVIADKGLTLFVAEN